MTTRKIKTHKLTSAGKRMVGLLVLSVISITTQLYVMSSNRAMNRELNEVNLSIKDVKENIESIKGEIRAIHEHSMYESLNSLDFIDVHHLNDTTDILVTNYWDGDGSSTDTTASGLSIKNFTINEDGMYTYNDKIVVATPNLERLNRPIYKGYNSHNLYDELTLTFNNTSYEAVVLDVCGACYGVGNETKQRYDVFTIGNVIGKVGGVLHE